MWAQYKKTLIPSQLMIVALCVAMRAFSHMPWGAVVVLFLVMQVGSLLGAWFGSKLKQRMRDDRDALPLQRRR